jgi:replicative DNA helicase Mcm
MEVSFAIKEMKEFLGRYEAEMLNSGGYFQLDFYGLCKYSPELADFVIENPTEGLKCLDIAAEQVAQTPIHVHIINLSKSDNKMVWELRSKDVDKLVSITGYIRKLSGVEHCIESALLKCSNCPQEFHIRATTGIPKMKECPQCKHKTIYVAERKLFDLQKVVIEEDSMDLEPTQRARRLLVELKDDLTRHDIDKVLQPSIKIRVIGILRDRVVKGTTYSKYIEANSIELVDSNYTTMKFSDKEIAEFKEFAATPTMIPTLMQSVFPNVHGHDTAKEALILAMFGGVNAYDSGILEERGIIHILLVGSPGTSKSHLLKRTVLFVPNSRITGGKTASAVGLVAAVTKDEELGGYVLEAGAIPMCHMGICGIDECDKISKEDIAMLNNTMVDLSVVIDKGNCHGRFNAETTIFAAANPTNRVFDNSSPIWKQIGLPKDFVDRFDLVIPLEAIKTADEQRKIAKIIFNKVSKDPVRVQSAKSREFITKYIAYAKQNIKPYITPESQEVLIENYTNLVKPQGEEEKAYFSSRLITNLIRLATASAKARLSDKVSQDDALRAVNLLISSFKKQGIIAETGLLDIEKLEAVVPSNKRDKMRTVLGYIREASSRSVDQCADIKDIVHIATQNGFTESIDEYIEKLQQSGDIFEPRVCKYKVLE